MQLLPAKEACQLVGATDISVRKWVKEGKLTKYENEKGNILVDKREILEMHPTIVCFFNQKGGVSKTDSCAVVADYYEQLFSSRAKKDDAFKRRILLVDFDPQSSLSQIYFTYRELYGDEDTGERHLTLYDYFEKRTPLQKIVKKYNEYIDVLPADITMAEKASIDSFLLPKLKEDFLPLFRKYSIILIDSPPAINAYSRLGILLANYILCPLLPNDNTYRALALALSTIKDVIAYNKDFIDYRCFISASRQLKTNIREFVKEKYTDELKSKLTKNEMPDFVGIVERETVKENIFVRYAKDKSIQRIVELMEELDDVFYKERSL